MLETPFGSIWLNANAQGLTRVAFSPIANAKTNQFTKQATQELQAYFAGKRQVFTVPLAIESGTAFQRAVWQGLQTIPYGQTLYYQELAECLIIYFFARFRCVASIITGKMTGRRLVWSNK